MFSCCFRPAANDDATVLATVAISSPSQPRTGRVVPAIADQLSERVRSVNGGQASRQLQPPGYSSGLSVHGGQGKAAQSSESGPTAWRLSGQWGSGKAAYKGTDKDRASGKGLLLSLISRGGSSDLFRSDPGGSQRRGARVKPAAAAVAGGDSDDDDDDGGDDIEDDECAVECSGRRRSGSGSRHGSGTAAAAVGHRKTAQPKRGILKKADNPLDAAAGGDEEALLRLAAALASNSGNTGAASGGGCAPGKSRTSMTAAARPGSANMGGAGSVFCTATAPADGLEMAAAAAAAGFSSLLPHNSSVLSSVDVTLDYKAGSGRSSGNAWMDAAAAAVSTAASSAATGGGSLRFSYNGGGSGSFLTAAGMPMSRLAHSSTASAALGGGAEAAAAPGGGGLPARAISVRTGIGGTAVQGSGSSSSGWPSGPSALYARDAATASAATMADLNRSLGGSDGGGVVAVRRVMSVSLAQLATAAQLTAQPVPTRRQLLSDTPTSYIMPLAPPQPQPSVAGIDGSLHTPRSYGGAPPRSPGAESAGHVMRIQGFESVSAPPKEASSRSIRGGGSRRGGGGSANLGAATREEILRSLPQGKSPIWYAHKLREILGTAEVDGGGGSGVVGGGGSGNLVEDLEYGAADRPVRTNADDRSVRFSGTGGGDSSLSRKISLSRFRGPMAGDGAPLARGGTTGDPSAPPVQLAGSRLLSPAQQQHQPAVSVRHLAVASTTTPTTTSKGGYGAPLVGASVWMNGQQLTLPGSMPGSVQDEEVTSGGGGGTPGAAGAAAALGGGCGRLSIERSAGSASGGGSGGGGAAGAAFSSAAAAAALLQRLRRGRSVSDGDSAQSEPLTKLRQFKPYDGGVGKLYDAGTAPTDLYRPPAVQYIGGGGGGGGGAAAPVRRVELRPAAAPAVYGLTADAASSPVVVLEAASRRLIDLLSELGTGNAVIQEEEEDEGED